MQVMTGYLLAGSIIGPGGLSFVSEMVQVCCPYSSSIINSNDSFIFLLASHIISRNKITLCEWDHDVLYDIFVYDILK